MDAMLCIATHLHLAPSHSRGLLAKVPENLEKIEDGALTVRTKISGKLARNKNG